MHFTIIGLLFLAVFTTCVHSLDYTDSENSVESCSSRDKCEGYTSEIADVDRSCRCDPDCVAYKDCCIDFDASRGLRSGQKRLLRNVQCLPYEHKGYTGVYAVSDCSKDWSGPRQIREKCVGSPDWTDSLTTYPAVDIDRKVTYRNFYCAECNTVNRDSVRLLQLEVKCGNQSGLPDQPIFKNLTYHNNTWGVYRFNDNDHVAKFTKCNVLFDVPEYLNNSVRLCRSNVISECAADWRNLRTSRICKKYMAIVYDKQKTTYRNTHCAICNNIKFEHLACTSSDIGKIRPFSSTPSTRPFSKPFSFTPLLNITTDLVEKQPLPTPRCPPSQKYDPFFQKCRRMICPSPFTMVDGKCIKV